MPNPSFEDTVNCPSGTAELTATAQWFNPTAASPDYYNACFGVLPPGSFGAGVPANDWGYQYAQDGNAYAGFVTFVSDSILSDYREYIEVKLIHPLTSSSRYYWCMYVSLLDSVDYATNNIGISLSDTLINNSTSQTVLNTNVYGNNNQVITDNINWTKINGSFIANGGEEYLRIGNFFNDIQTSVIQIQQNDRGGPSGYYYVDNVYLGETPCDDTEINLPNVFTPNNDGINDEFLINFPYERLVIYNRWGQIIFESKKEKKNWNGKNINGKDVPEGTYFYIITTKDNTYKKTLLLTR